MTTPALTRRGITLVEVLVVLGVLLILAGLLLPAVQRARAAARRVQCSNQLRQMAQALQAYHDTWQTLPGVLYQRYDPTVRTLPANGYLLVSPQLSLLPYLGWDELYNAFNFTGYWDDPLAQLPRLADVLYASELNRTALQTPIDLFLCPSDRPLRLVAPGTNYFANAGSGPTLVYTPEESPEFGNGVFRFPVTLTFADFTDGQTSTAVFAERVRGGGLSREPRSLRGLLTYSGLTAPSADAQHGACRQLAASSRPSAWFTQVGAFWAVAAYRYTLYNHIQSPNGPVPDCANGTYAAMVTARSFHPRGVNVAFADGSVRFVPQTIELSIWRAMATPAGGELAQY